MPYEALESLKDTVKATDDQRTARYVLFSVSGFDYELREAEEDGDVVLVDLDELVHWKNVGDNTENE